MFPLLNILIFQAIIFPAVTVMHFPSTIPFFCLVIFLTILTLFVVSYKKKKTSKSKIISLKVLIFTFFFKYFPLVCFLSPLQSILLHNRVHSHCTRLHAIITLSKFYMLPRLTTAIIANLFCLVNVKTNY